MTLLLNNVLGAYLHLAKKKNVFVVNELIILRETKLGILMLPLRTLSRASCLHLLRLLIGSLDCLCPLQLARVITLDLVFSEYS